MANIDVYESRATHFFCALALAFSEILTFQIVDRQKVGQEQFS